MYEDAGRLIQYLSKWNCSTASLEGCIISLADDLALNGFWNNLDSQLAKDWIKDLKQLNYTYVSSTLLK